MIPSQLALLRGLYGSTAQDMRDELGRGLDALPAMFAQLRVGEPGDADRAAHLARQLGGLERLAARLAQRLTKP